MNVSPNKHIKGRVLRMPSLKDNFGLTKSEFDQYVINLRNGDETLITKVFKNHFHFSVKYVMSKFSVSEEIAYDNCMETMLDFREKIITGKIQYHNLVYLYTRMAVNRFVDGILHKKKVSTAIDVFSKNTSQSTIEREKFMNVLDQSIEKLDTTSQEFIKEHFYSDKGLADIAEIKNVQYATIRKRKQRTLAKLKSTFLEILKGENR